MNKDKVRQLEDDIQEAKQFIDMSKALDRLQSNRDFKTVIIDGYLTAEAVRLVHLRGDPNMQTPERQASILASIDAIGGLLNYFRTVDFKARTAETSISANEAMIEELNAEDAQ